MERKCVFCRIIAGELPSITVKVWPDAIAIVPLAPVTEDRFEPGQGHVLVIPRRHVVDFTEDPAVTAATCARAAEFAAERGGDMNMITSKGENATQTVFHLHVHLVPRVQGDQLPLPWTPQQTRVTCPCCNETMLNRSGHLPGCELAKVLVNTRRGDLWTRWDETRTQFYLCGVWYPMTPAQAHVLTRPG